MATIKLVAFLCVAALATSAATQEIKQVQVKDALDDLLALVKNLETVLTDAINDALAAVDGLLDQVTGAADQIVTALTGTLQNVVQGLLGQIEDLVKEATAADIDVSDCVGTSVADISALPSEFLQNATTCLNNQIRAAENEINKTISDVTSTLDVISNLANEISSCEQLGGLIAPICYAQVTAEVGNLLISLPLRITSDVTSITKYVATLIPNLKICEGAVVNDVTKTGGDMVAKVTECVNNKLHPSRL